MQISVKLLLYGKHSSRHSNALIWIRRARELMRPMLLLGRCPVDYYRVAGGRRGSQHLHLLPEFFRRWLSTFIPKDREQSVRILRVQSSACHRLLHLRRVCADRWDWCESVHGGVWVCPRGGEEGTCVGWCRGKGYRGQRGEVSNSSIQQRETHRPPGGQGVQAPGFHSLISIFAYILNDKIFYFDFRIHFKYEKILSKYFGQSYVQNILKHIPSRDLLFQGHIPAIESYFNRYSLWKLSNQIIFLYLIIINLFASLHKYLPYLI